MDAFHILLTVIIVILLVDKGIERHRAAAFQERMNRALIARTVPEYAYNAKDDIKKTKAENELALGYQKIIDENKDPRGTHYPVT